MSMEKVFVYDSPDYTKETIKRYIVESGVLRNVSLGDTVLLKPNFVQESRNQDDDWDYVVTHPVMISAVIELLCEKLSGKGRIILADAPMTGSSFKKIIQHFPVEDWNRTCASYNVPFEIIDLRDEEWEMADNGIILKRKKQQGDPRGKVLVNLKEDKSEFFTKPVTKQRLYGADYDIAETNKAHNGIDNYYSVSQSVIEADVFINMPKLKTHKKAGITCCLKNLIGINTNKNLLPHHTIGTPKEGGDQFASSSSETALESTLTMAAKKIVVRFNVLSPLLVPLKRLATMVWGDNRSKPRSGGWYGNDTLWRTILDLNKVMFYADSDGMLREESIEKKKRYIGIVDGIYAGQGDGPVEPDLLKAGVIICGTNPVAIDCVATKIMGFDYKKIPQVVHAFGIKKYKIIEGRYEEIICTYNGRENRLTDFEYEGLKWQPARGWIGHIEL